MVLGFIFNHSNFNGARCYFGRVGGLISSNGGGVILVAPRRCGFATRGGLLGVLNRDKVGGIHGLSFAELMGRITGCYNNAPCPILSTNTGTTLVGGTVSSMASRLILFNGGANEPTFVASVLSVRSRVASYYISPSRVDRLTTGLNSGELLTSGLSSVDLVLRTCGSLLRGHFLSPTNGLSHLCSVLVRDRCLGNGVLFVSKFGNFITSRCHVVGLVVRGTRDMAIALYASSPRGLSGCGLFTCMGGATEALGGTTTRYGGRVGAMFLGGGRETGGSFVHLYRTRLCSSSPGGVSYNSSTIVCHTSSIGSRYSCATLVVERRLRTNAGTDSVTIVYHSVGGFHDELSCTFEGCRVPCFSSRERSVDTRPVVIFIVCLLEDMVCSFHSSSVLDLTGAKLATLSRGRVGLLRGCVCI